MNTVPDAPKVRRRTTLQSLEAAYPIIITGILSMGNVMMTAFQTITIAFGVIFILLVMVIVEQLAIRDGLTWFMTDVYAAGFGAAAVVMLNVIVDLKIVHVEHEEKYRRQADKQWSLRLYWQTLKYRAGAGERWKAQTQSPAQSFITLRTLVTITIFVLAIGGRMHSSIQKASFDDAGNTLPVARGIESLIQNSTLADAAGWIGGTIFTMLAVIAVQRLTHFVGRVVVEIQEDLKQRERNRKAAETRRLAKLEKTAEKEAARLAALAQQTEALARLSAQTDRQTDKSNYLSDGVSRQTDRQTKKQTDRQTDRPGGSFEFDSQKRAWIEQMYAENPGYLDMSVHKVAALVSEQKGKVGKDLVLKVRRELQNGSKIEA